MVKLNGPVPPTTVTFNVVLCPTQMGLDPVKLNVALDGGVFTVTVALLPATPAQAVASVTLVMV